MGGAAGEVDGAALRVSFDRRLKLEFHGSKVTSDAGLLPFRDLDDALGLTKRAGEVLADTRTGQNSRHTLIAQRCLFGGVRRVPPGLFALRNAGRWAAYLGTVGL